MATINIQDFIFGDMTPEKKLETINKIGDEQIRRIKESTILRIIEGCKNNNGEFRINLDRRAGNHWNSNIEYLYIYKGKAIIMFYVQDDSTDTSTSESYEVFNSKQTFRGHCRLGSFQYNSSDIAGVIRCILAEYVYYTYIEKDEREMYRRLDSIAGWKVTNPVFNYFFEKWDCWHRMDYNENLRKAYYAGKKAVEEYAKEHLNELYGKPENELQDIYKKVFQKAANY
jgi:hypothetical protein